MRMRSRKMTTDDCWFILVIGLIIGTIFTFGMGRWQSAVTQEEAIPVQATLAEVDGTYNKRHLSTIRLRFSDRGQLSIDSSSATEALLTTLSGIPEGTVCAMLIHPVGDSVLYLEAEGKVLLEFDKASRALAAEGYGFMALGLFMYAGAAVAAVKLIREKTRRG